MNPAKLAQFAKNQLVDTAADQYLRQLIQEEMCRGLKRYMEVELFPRIHLKVGRGISLGTARRWLHLEGFRYISHKKGLYFDGHDRPDVLAYCQNHFLPTMKSLEPCLVQYVVGDVEKPIPPSNFVERLLVLCSHDESTSQANDSQEKSWVLGDQHPLCKKGSWLWTSSKRHHLLNSWLVGRCQSNPRIWKKLRRILDRRTFRQTGMFIHINNQSLSDTLQLTEKIIPTFERAHGPGYQALFMVDNSQGHSAYAEDALLVS